jgi:hypothetical protein
MTRAGKFGLYPEIDMQELHSNFKNYLIFFFVSIKYRGTLRDL